MSGRKKQISGIILFVLVALGNCTTQKKVAYEFPSAMAEPVRQEYEKLCEKGKILYDLNCAVCHNQKVRGKSVIPDFSVDQISGYEIRVLNAKHEMGIPEEKVTPEELGLISTFLTYKKKNSTSLKK